MRFIFFGMPGAGKGTQAKKLSAKLNIPHISTGDMLRAAITKGTELGKLAKKLIDGGNFVPDDVIIGVVDERFNEEDCQKGFILDGFPRTIPQAGALIGLLKKRNWGIDAVINIDVDANAILKRLTGRRICKTTGEVYHIDQNPPPADVEVYQRDDDREDVIKHRLDVYIDQTKDIIDFYKKKDLIVSVDGNDKPEEVFLNIAKECEKY